MEILRDVPLSSRTTFGVGGDALFVVEGATVEDIREARRIAQTENIPFLVLGGGSNILADDGQMRAVFFTLTSGDIRLDGETLIADAGASWDSVVALSVAEGLWGIENLSDIPGTVGGACVQNIGAYGAALSETLAWVDAYDTAHDKVVRLSARECAFGYRDSLFKREPARFVIMRAALTLKKEGAPATHYRDLQETFGTHIPTLREVRAAVLKIRSVKFPDLAREGTAGSFFKNPILTPKEAEALRALFPDVPLFDTPEQDGVKVPLAWFLDRVLRLRGFALGPVRCFEKQPLVIVASRAAHAKDVRALAAHVMRVVEEKIGIALVPEVCIVRGDAFQSRVDF
jgi:UDP-N-acetylmuramate dehydrogenase